MKEDIVIVMYDNYDGKWSFWQALKDCTPQEAIRNYIEKADMAHWEIGEEDVTGEVQAGSRDSRVVAFWAELKTA